MHTSLESFAQTSPVSQSLPKKHVLPAVHDGQNGPPQSVSDSSNVCKKKKGPIELTSKLCAVSVHPDPMGQPAARCGTTKYGRRRA